MARFCIARSTSAVPQGSGVTHKKLLSGAAGSGCRQRLDIPSSQTRSGKALGSPGLSKLLEGMLSGLQRLWAVLHPSTKAVLTSEYAVPKTCLVLGHP